MKFFASRFELEVSLVRGERAGGDLESPPAAAGGTASGGGPGLRGAAGGEVGDAGVGCGWVGGVGWGGVDWGGLGE